MKKHFQVIFAVILCLMLTFMCACTKNNGGDNEQDVQPEPEDSVLLQLSENNTTIDLYQTSKLTATYKEQDVTPSFTTSDSSVVTVTSGGDIAAQKVGKATITATYEGETARCIVNVIDSGERPTLTNLESEYSIATGHTLTISPRVKYRGEYISANLSVEATGSNIETEIVDGKLKLKGVAPGEDTFTLSGSVRDYNLGAFVVSVAVQNRGGVMYSGGDVVLLTEGTDAETKHLVEGITVIGTNGVKVNNPVLEFESTDDTVADYDSSTNKIYAKTVGECKIRVKYDTLYNEINVRVDRVNKGVLNLKNSLLIGGNEALNTTIIKKVPLSTIETVLHEANSTTGFSDIREIYDLSNNATVNYTVNGAYAEITNYNSIYDGNYGRFNLEIRTTKYAIKCSLVNASHIINAKADLLPTSELATQYHNVAGTGTGSNPTVGWYIAVAKDIDMQEAVINKVYATNKSEGFGAQYKNNATIVQDSKGNNAASSSEYLYFNGTFDGMGHKIENAVSQSYGFICNLGATGKICNLAYLNAKTNGQGLIGNSFMGSMENCIVSSNGQLAKNTITGFYFYNQGKTTGFYKNCIGLIENAQSNAAIFHARSSADEWGIAHLENCFAISATVTNVDLKGSPSAGVIFNSAAAFKSAMSTPEGAAAMATFNSYWSSNNSGVKLGNNTVISW